MVNKDLFKKKIPADKFLADLKKEVGTKELSMIRMCIKWDKKERFEKPVVG